MRRSKERKANAGQRLRTGEKVKNESNQCGDFVDRIALFYFIFLYFIGFYYNICGNGKHKLL